MKPVKPRSRGEARDIVIRYVLFTLIVLALWDFEPSALITATQLGAYTIIKALNYDVVLQANQILGERVAIEVIKECSSFLAYLVSAALFVYTRGMAWIERLRKWAFGALALFALNASRIALVFWIGTAYGEQSALDVHLWIWQFFMAPFLVLLWFALMGFKTDRLPWVDDALFLLRKAKRRA